jgi:hypothetical protein
LTIGRRRPPWLPIIMDIEGLLYLPIIMDIEGPPYLPIIIIAIEWLLN